MPKLLAGRQIMHFIDNQGACAGLVKGYSRATDAGLIVNAFHAFNVVLRCNVYFEYVPTKANPADLSSRLGLDELRELYAELGFTACVQRGAP